MSLQPVQDQYCPAPMQAQYNAVKIDIYDPKVEALEKKEEKPSLYDMPQKSLYDCNEPQNKGYMTYPVPASQFNMNPQITNAAPSPYSMPKIEDTPIIEEPSIPEANYVDSVESEVSTPDVNFTVTDLQ